MVALLSSFTTSGAKTLATIQRGPRARRGVAPPLPLTLLQRGRMRRRPKETSLRTRNDARRVRLALRRAQSDHGQRAGGGAELRLAPRQRESEKPGYQPCGDGVLLSVLEEFAIDVVRRERLRDDFDGCPPDLHSRRGSGTQVQEPVRARPEGGSDDVRVTCLVVARYLEDRLSHLATGAPAVREQEKAPAEQPPQ